MPFPAAEIIPKETPSDKVFRNKTFPVDRQYNFKGNIG